MYNFFYLQVTAYKHFRVDIDAKKFFKLIFSFVIKCKEFKGTCISGGDKLFLCWFNNEVNK